LFAEIDQAALHFPKTRKVFLADGNAMVLSTDKLTRILNYLNDKFKNLIRITAYAIPKDLKNKTVDELISLKEGGLKMIYVGIETGDDELLKLINKGETAESTISSMKKAKQAGIKSSVMIINGLGGKHFSVQHSENSTKVINAIQPEFLSTLILSFPYGVDHYEKRFAGEFEEMNILELLSEQHTFISNLNLESTIFRSDHASNYLSLKGILGRDKQLFLGQLQSALAAPEFANLRQEWQRGL
jgi:radical SAM superfamily enzyme YgiQ (UPF0313 family)